MTNQHPITPPPELVQQWADMLSYRSDHDVFSLAAQWGSAQELAACCMWITREKSVSMAEELGNVRRPKPPSLKELALKALKVIEFEYVHSHSPSVGEATTGTIRRALEQLPND
jgi:hypothetical protein